MDFGTLLSVAQKNENNTKQPSACYQTKFAPPKKQNKQTRTLSQNIKKFLARKEEEERKKAEDEKKKRENLLALRDQKAQSRINKHLKVCKAANKSVLADAIDNENTAVTIAGPSQPDEDDYGYVSQEASAFYNQLMNKYNNAPAQKPIFSQSGKKTVKDIASTKDRVRQALKQQEEEEALGHRRKRKSGSLNSKDSADSKETAVENDVSNDKNGKDREKNDKVDKVKVKRKPLPPPIDFSELLKIAEKKQHEPILIEVKPKIEEPVRLMTKRQMKEYTKEKEWRERKEQREKAGLKTASSSPCPSSSKTSSTGSTDKSNKPQIGRIPKTSEREKLSGEPSKTTSSSAVSTSTANSTAGKLHSEKSAPRKPNVSKPSERDTILEERKKLEDEKRKLQEMRQAIEEEKKKLELCKSKQAGTKSVEKIADKGILRSKLMEKQLPSKETKQKRDQPTSIGANAKLQQNNHQPANSRVPPRLPALPNGKPKQFPPADMRQLKMKNKQPHSKDFKQLSHVNKRRIHDRDEEEDYDSELEDFIDDGPQEESEDYSKYISEIFGYDKSKYRNVDEDDTEMESSFAQQLKEEYVSTKIGIMEDLEDIRMEAMEKKRKALIRKKMKK